MNLIKRRKQAVARRAAGLNGKGTAEDLNAAAKNDEEIESFLDTTKLAYKLSLKNTTHRLNYFFDDLDIYRAVVKGDKDFFLNSRIQKKRILSYRYKSGTCFHLAAKCFQKDVCNILVSLYGFDPNQKCNSGCTPLHWIMATSFKRLNEREDTRTRFKSTVDYLILKRVNVNAKDASGLTALHYAAKSNNYYGVERLLKEWTLRLDEVDHLKQTALHTAFTYGSDRVIQVMLACEKMHLEYLTSAHFDHLPLHHACRSYVENSEMVELLLVRTIELKLNKLMRTHLNAAMRKKLAAKLIPMVLSCIEADAKSGNAIRMTQPSLAVTSDVGCGAAGAVMAASNGSLGNSQHSVAHSMAGNAHSAHNQLRHPHQYVATSSALRFIDDELFDQNEFILNKFEFVRVLDETSCFMRELVNRKDVADSRPLHLAIEQNYVNLVSLLFKYGAVATLHSYKLNLPIHIAAKSGSIAMFDLLEQHNCISFKSNEDMNNLMHIGVANNNVEFVRLACEYWKRKCASNASGGGSGSGSGVGQSGSSLNINSNSEIAFVFEAVNSSYMTPLFLATSKSNTDSVRLLIEMIPASLYHVDDLDRNIFHICALYNAHHTFNFLIERMDARRQQLHQQQQQQQQQQTTAAKQTNETKTTTTTTTNGRPTAASRRKRDNSKNVQIDETPVVINQTPEQIDTEAIIENALLASTVVDSPINEDNVRLLTSDGGGEEEANAAAAAIASALDELELFESMLYASDINGDTILHLAATRHSIKTLNLIFYLIVEGRISFGDLVARRNLNGETFFQIACNKGCLDIVELMLKQRANLGSAVYDPLRDVDNEQNTPLLSAIAHNQYYSTFLLIEHGAALDNENMWKQTAVHLACKIGSYEITELLIKSGAPVHSLDMHNNNALVYACRNGNYELVKYLLDTEHAPALLNQSCLDTAIEHNNVNIVELLFNSRHWQKIIDTQPPLTQTRAIIGAESKSKTPPTDGCNSQIRRLIEKMPDKMETLLDKCYDARAGKYNFRLLDHHIVDRIEDHPLYLITESKDERLITHHTTRKLLELKSRTFPRIAFLLDLCLYLLFVAFCTLYHLISWKEKAIETYDDYIDSQMYGGGVVGVGVGAGSVTGANVVGDLSDSATNLEMAVAVGSATLPPGSDSAASAAAGDLLLMRDAEAVAQELMMSDEMLFNMSRATNRTFVIYHIRLLNLRVPPALLYIVYATLLIVVLIHLSKEFFQLISYSFIGYFSSVDNWFQLTALLITIFSLIPGLDYRMRIAIGSFSILYAWICLSLFFQDMELFSLGRYIVAFRKTIQNSFKFMPFFVMICLGFFFCFKVGERFNSDVNDNLIVNESHVSTSSTNFIRIISMMVGELDLSGLEPQLDNISDYFRLETMYNTVVFIFFVFMMCIIVLSLFEGIAVGEVKAVLDKAHIDIISANIVYVLKIQKITYTIYRLFARTGVEPMFMDIGEYVIGKNITTKIEHEKKKSTDPVLRIENILVTLSFNLNALSRQLEEQTRQIRSIRKRLES